MCAMEPEQEFRRVAPDVVNVTLRHLLREGYYTSASQMINARIRLSSEVKRELANPHVAQGVLKAALYKDYNTLKVLFASGISFDEIELSEKEKKDLNHYFSQLIIQHDLDNISYVLKSSARKYLDLNTSLYLAASEAIQDHNQSDKLKQTFFYIFSALLDAGADPMQEAKDWITGARLEESVFDRILLLRISPNQTQQLQDFVLAMHRMGAMPTQKATDLAASRLFGLPGDKIKPSEPIAHMIREWVANRAHYAQPITRQRR